MSIFKEEYRPGRVTTSEDSQSYPKHYIKIHSGKTQVNLPGVAIPSVVLAGSIALSFVWWPILLINVASIIFWIARPETRVISQKKESYVVKDEMKGAYGTVYAPEVDWGLYNKNSLYRESVMEWLDVVRQTGDVGVSQESWNKYFQQTRELAERQSPVEPNFEKLKIIRELMNEK